MYNMSEKPKIIFDDDSDSDGGFNTNNEYAKKYETWRKKEELNKLKAKHGDEALKEEDDSSSTSDDDEDAVELTEDVEKDFFKTLSYLKKKDPKIYDQNVSFFKSKDNESKANDKKEKYKPVYLKDLERKVLENGTSILSEEERVEEDFRPEESEPMEKKEIKELKLDGSDNDEENDDLFELRQDTKYNTQEGSDYLRWLAGQTEKLPDPEIESELKPLKQYWNNPNLDSGEKFLRDYILNKRYLDNDKEDYIPTYDEIIHDSDKDLSEDEEEIEKQEEFEHKYNFRFEDPDQNFIKRYPRTLEHTLRQPDNKRKVKRAETKERKKREKEEKMAEIQRLRELKRQEIEERLAKLKEVTGVTDLPFQDEDIDGDFDPEAHDRRMQTLFNDEFYQGPESDQKPEFPEIDDELEIENWDRWEASREEDNQYEPHCEDDNFNMDADYDPMANLKNELVENSKGKKKRRRKSKVAEALSQEKPKFDPNDKNYEKYFDDYYKLDCEDIIGDLPCRFKYREVPPNDFGLTVEEILLAKDKELNRWSSLKKAVQRRPDHVEKYEQKVYAEKGKNINLKRKLLPSLFMEETEGVDSKNVPVKQGEKSGNDVEQQETKTKSKRRKKGKNDNNNDSIERKEQSSTEANGQNKTLKRKRKDSGKVDKKANTKKVKNAPENIGFSDARLSAYGINPRKYKNKLKYGPQSKA